MYSPPAMPHRCAELGNTIVVLHFCPKAHDSRRFDGGHVNYLAGFSILPRLRHLSPRPTQHRWYRALQLHKCNR